MSVTVPVIPLNSAQPSSVNPNTFEPDDAKMETIRAALALLEDDELDAVRKLLNVESAMPTAKASEEEDVQVVSLSH